MAEVWADKILNGGAGIEQELTPEQKKQMKAVADFVAKWSLQSEQERESDLPSYDDINEAFLDGDYNKLHDSALKLRVALSEIDKNILSHARNIISLARELRVYRDDPNDDDQHIPDFLKSVPPQLREPAIQEIIMSEAAGIGMRLMQFDLDHLLDKDREA